MADEQKRARPLRIRRGKSAPEAPLVTVAMVERMIEQKTEDLRIQVEQLRSNSIKAGQVLYALKAAVGMATAGTGSTKMRLNELLEQLTLALASLDGYIGLPEVYSSVSPSMQQVFEHHLRQARLGQQLAVNTETGRYSRGDLLSTEGDDIIENVSDEDGWDD